MWSPNKIRRVAAAASALALFGVARAAIGIGDAFPPLPQAPATDLRVPALLGKVVLVDFWASWCAPCKASFPAYARIYADYAARGLVVVGVSVDDDPADYANFVRKHAPPFPTIRDRDKRLVNEVGIPAMPTSYLIGRDGRVRFVHEGFHSAETEPALRAEITALLAEGN